LLESVSNMFQVIHFTSKDQAVLIYLSTLSQTIPF